MTLEVIYVTVNSQERGHHKRKTIKGKFMDSNRVVRLVVELEDMCKHVSQSTECIEEQEYLSRMGNEIKKFLDEEGIIVDRVTEDDPQIYIKI